MTAPTLPTAAVPLWASLLNYGIGPDILTPTKVDSTSVSPNGHIAGKDFASTAQEMNSWQNLASQSLIFVFDSLTAAASQTGADDRRVIITDNDGFVAMTGAHLLGSTAVSLPTLLVDGSPSGSPAIAVVSNTNDDPGLRVTAGSIITDGFLVELLDSIGQAAGLDVTVNDPDFTALRVIVSSAANLGDGVAIVGQGGAGDISNVSGTGIIAIGGLDGGAGAGEGLFATHASPAGRPIFAVQSATALPQTPTVEAMALNDGDGFVGRAVDGHAAKLESLGNGAPLLIVPKTTDPTDSNSPAGEVWIVNRAGDAAQHDLMVKLGPLAGQRRWLAGYDDQHCRLIQFLNGPFTSVSTLSDTIIVNNLGFGLDNVPQDTGVFVVISLSFTVSRDTDSIHADDRDVGFIQFTDNGPGGGVVFTKDMSIQSGFTQLSGPLPGDPITWGDRRQAGIEETVVFRVGYTMPNAGAQDFKLAFRTDGDVIGGTVISDVFIEIETAT